MEPAPQIPPAAGSSNWQQIARIALATAVVAVGLWILLDFLPALAWAAVLAIALWPLYGWLHAVHHRFRPPARNKPSHKRFA